MVDGQICVTNGGGVATENLHRLDSNWIGDER
jgi:hypothetical protein